MLNADSYIESYKRDLRLLEEVVLLMREATGHELRRLDDELYSLRNKLGDSGRLKMAISLIEDRDRRMLEYILKLEWIILTTLQFQSEEDIRDSFMPSMQDKADMILTTYRDIQERFDLIDGYSIQRREQPIPPSF